jgi:hypothetical protein
VNLPDASRRAFLASMAAGGAATVLRPGLAAAAPTVRATPSGVTFAGSKLPIQVQSVIAGAEFLEAANSYSFDRNSLAINAGSGSQYFVTAIRTVPVGSVITEVDVQVSGVGETTASGVLYRVSTAFNNTSFAALTSANAQSSSLGAPWQIKLSDGIGWTVDNATVIYIDVTSPSAFSILSATVTYQLTTASPAGFYPIAPHRVYDSRFTSPTGALAGGQQRVVSVANGYADNSATVNLADVIPAGARAVAYNLAVVGTLGSGYLSVNPGDATSPAGASINWFGPNQILANGQVGLLDANRQFMVACGGTNAATHFVIDVQGYYL